MHLAEGLKLGFHGKRKIDRYLTGKIFKFQFDYVHTVSTVHPSLEGDVPEN